MRRFVSARHGGARFPINNHSLNRIRVSRGGTRL